MLTLLPPTRYELAEWKQAMVQFNCHIAVDNMYYSVPHEYIQRKVNVRVTASTIDVFYKQPRIASHRRLFGRKGQYSTDTAHMPEDHQKYLEWNGDLITQKYVMGSPLYRLELDFSRSGYPLSRQTMSNWMIYCSDTWLKPLYEELHRLLLMEDIIHADETDLQVQRKAQTKSYM